MAPRTYIGSVNYMNGIRMVSGQTKAAMLVELLHRTAVFSEIPLKDPRLLIGLPGILPLLVLHRRQPSLLRTRFAVLLAFIGSAWLWCSDCRDGETSRWWRPCCC